MDLVAALAAFIARRAGRKPLLIGFDGVDASGKTTLADAVAAALAAAGVHALRLSIDRFHRPRAERLRRGADSPEGYYLDSFDLPAVVEGVLAPLRAGQGVVRHGGFDYRTDAAAPAAETPVTADLVVLFDGIFLQRPELAGYWDYTVFLDVSFDTVLARAKARDADYLGGVAEVERRYRARYIPGQRLYLEACRPLERADFVIDNNDYDRPRLVKGRLDELLVFDERDDQADPPRPAD